MKPICFLAISACLLWKIRLYVIWNGETESKNGRLLRCMNFGALYGELQHLSLLTFAQGTNTLLVSFPFTSASPWLSLCWIHNSAYSLIYTLETYTLIYGELFKTYCGFYWGDACNCLYHTSHNLKKEIKNPHDNLFSPTSTVSTLIRELSTNSSPTFSTNIWPLLNRYHSDIYCVTHNDLVGPSWADTSSSICPNPSWWTKCLCS